VPTPGHGVPVATSPCELINGAGTSNLGNFTRTAEGFTTYNPPGAKLFANECPSPSVVVFDEEPGFLTLSTGELMYSEGLGYACFHSDGSGFVLAGVYNVYGGTGRFAGAIGSSVATGNTNPNGTFTAQFNGVIQLRG
jgi:hypothetical protein